MSQYNEFVNFYSRAKINKILELARLKEEKPTSRINYEIERTSAFIDWCEFILDRLSKTDKAEFTGQAWREVYGVFEYPAFPGDEQ